MGILVAVGDDDRFETVLQVALRLAAGLEQRLYVVHVTQDQNASGTERAFRNQVQTFLEEADVQTDVSLQYLDRGGLRSGTAVGRQLLDLAADVGVDHIVLGHRSKNRLATAREGHTAFVVVEEATVPVTIVPEAVE